MTQGNPQAGEFKRITNYGKEVWLRGIYNPVFDENGNMIKIIKTALDITKDKFITTDSNQKLEAISVSNILIEYDMNGHILNTNKNFLNLIEFTFEEIIGWHHSLFVPDHIKNTI